MDDSTRLKLGFQIFWVVTIIYLVFTALTYRVMPVDGATGDLTSFKSGGYLVKWVIDVRTGGLQVGDLIERVDGYRLDEWLYGQVEIGEVWFTGGEVDYQVRREGEVEKLTVMLRPHTIGSLTRHFGVQFAGIIVLVFIGSLTFWKRPDYPAARWFMVLCMASAAHMVGDAWNFQIALLARPFLFWLHFFNEQISFIIIHLAALMQALTFPRSLGTLRKSRVAIVSSSMLISVVLTFGVLLVVSPLGEAFDISNRISLVFSAFFLTSAVIIGIIRLRRLEDPRDRAKLKWWLYIGGVSFFILVPFYYMPIVIAGEPVLPPLVASGLIMIGLPIALNLAMLDVRLYGIDFLINRSLVYGSLTYILVGVFGLSLYGINRLAFRLTGHQQPALAVIVSAAVFGGLIEPVRSRLQRFVDQRLYRINIDYERLEKIRKEIDGLRIDIQRDLSLPPYEQLEYLGSGGMAVTYKAVNPETNENVAIKLMPEHLLHEQYYKVRFQREIGTLRIFDHPHIVKLIDHGEEWGQPFMVMEYLDGMTLTQHIMLSGRLSVEGTLEICTGIASALDYIHEKQVVHRDIKPSNIMLARDSEKKFLDHRAVLMDFGITKFLAGEETHVTFNEVVGTFDYIAPEQIEESRSIDHRADIYSLGIVVYRMVTGRLPYRTENLGAQLMAHIRQQPLDPREFEPSLPDGFAAAILRAIEKNPADRFNSAGEFVEALRG